jgi:hypothetical protein
LTARGPPQTTDRRLQSLRHDYLDPELINIVRDEQSNLSGRAGQFNGGKPPFESVSADLGF